MCSGSTPRRTWCVVAIDSFLIACYALSYLGIASAVGRYVKVTRAHSFRCYCVEPSVYGHESVCRYRTVPLFSGLLWPCATVVLAGFRCADWVIDRQDRARVLAEAEQVIEEERF